MVGKYLHFTILSITFVLVQFSSWSQCESFVVIKLNNNKGGVYSGQNVELKSQNDGKVYKTTSDSKGEVKFQVPCDQRFDLTIANYTRKEELNSPSISGAESFEEYSYSPDMALKDKMMAMSEADKTKLDNQLKSLPDTTKIFKSQMPKPLIVDGFMQYFIIVKNLENKPLVNEKIIVSGNKRNKHFKGETDATGKIQLYLPKGDVYTVNFKYHKNYYSHEIAYTIGTGTGSMELMYMGTEEYLRRKKIEDERIKAEEKRLAEEKKRFEEWCKAEKLSREEGLKRKMKELEDQQESLKQGIVYKVLNRNKWSEKLIVCDLTGSMMPYAYQLSLWYQLNVAKEKNLQFVFFNDGDSKLDSQKKIGATKGIYYQKSKGLDSLTALMNYVQLKGYGGDCPENNMEALIKGVKQATPYKELVMIADNYAPVKDIELLKNFNKPVHVVLCGASENVLADYLLIAWKTKGSIHTIEEDIDNIANMMEGQSIKINGITYKIMGGEFVKIGKA